jgi:hypothetical protein
MGGAGCPIRTGRFEGTIGGVIGADSGCSDMSACIYHKVAYLDSGEKSEVVTSTQTQKRFQFEISRDHP